MADLLNEKGFNSCCVSSKNTKEERTNIINKFHTGELNVVTNSMLWTEGFDEPSVDCIINLRATKSESLYRQILGRGLRLSPETNKENLLVLDFLWHSGRKGYDVLSPVNLFIDESRIPYANDILKDNEEISIEELQNKSNASFLLAENLKKAANKTFLGTKFKEIENPNLRYIYNNNNELDSICVRNDEAIEFYTRENPFYYVPYGQWELTKCTEKQINFLKQLGINPKNVPYKGLAVKIINTFFRNKDKTCSYKQYKILKKKGFKNILKWDKNEVSEMIDIISTNNWKLPYNIHPTTYIPKSLK